MRELIRRTFRAAGFELRRLEAAPASPGARSATCRRFSRTCGPAASRQRRSSTWGARGAVAAAAKTAFPGAALHLVEPLAEKGPHLDAFCSAHPGSRWLNVGLGEASAERVFYPATEASSGMTGSSFVPPQPADLGSFEPPRTVPVRTIDALLAEGWLVPPDLVKVDVQGFELAVLRGASRLFGQTEMFLLELSLYPFQEGQPLLHEVVEWMAARGYLLYDVTEWMRRPNDGALGQFDGAFVRADSPLRRHTRWG